MPFGGLLTLGLIGGATSLIGGGIASSGAKSASNAQVASAGAANNTLKNASDNSLLTDESVLNQQQGDLAPYYAAGTTGLGTLANSLSPGGNLYNTPILDLSGFNFNPGDLTKTPGYQFTEQQGDAALQRNAAATGTLGGNAAEAAQTFGQGLASTTYNNAFNQALSTYGANTSSQISNYNAALSSQNALYNRLYGLAGIGQSAANTDVATLGAYGGAVSGNELGTAQAQSNNQVGAGNASAAGTVGATNAWSGAVGNLGQTAQQIAALQSASSYKPTGTSSGSNSTNYANGVLEE